MVGFACIVLTSGLSIAFSLMKFGAASQIWPVPIVAVINFLILAYLAKFRPQFPPTIAKWRELIGSASKFWAVQAIWSILGQIDYIILAFLLANSEVGEYYFAYMLATQAVRIATGNLYFVLFPSFSSMGSDHQRQASAAFRICQVVPMVLIPACLAQAFLSEPLLDWMYPSKWKFASELILILSIGLAIYPISMVVEALMHAQHRFREYYLYMVCSTILFVACVTVGTLLFGLIGAASGVSTHYLLVTPAFTAIALSRYFPWRTTILEIYLKPMVIGLSVLLVSLSFRHYLIHSGLSNFNSSIAVGLFSPLLFLLIAYSMLGSRFHGLFDVLRGRVASQTV